MKGINFKEHDGTEFRGHTKLSFTVPQILAGTAHAGSQRQFQVKVRRPSTALVPQSIAKSTISSQPIEVKEGYPGVS